VDAGISLLLDDLSPELQRGNTANQQLCLQCSSLWGFPSLEKFLHTAFPSRS